MIDLNNLTQYKKVYIQPHNFPDADAIASSYAFYKLLKSLGINAELICATERNASTKPNIDKMIREIEEEITFNIKMIPEKEEDFALILLDVQYKNSNLIEIPAKYIYCIDHHEDTLTDIYVESDIRPTIGSSSTIVTEYYKKYKATPEPLIATLLGFGIYQDTGALSEKVTNLDSEYKSYLNPIMDQALYNELIHSSFTFNDMKLFSKALENIDQYRQIVFCQVDVNDDNMLGNISDILSEISDIDIVVAYSVRKFGVKLSIRSYNKLINAVDIVHHLTRNFLAKGGGHLNKAGGFIPIEEFTARYKNITFDPWIKSEVITYCNKWMGSLMLQTDKTLEKALYDKSIVVVKRQIPVRYIDLSDSKDETIKVSTLVGAVTINTNTHNILVGVLGDIYPIGKDTFEKTYTKLPSNKVECPSDIILQDTFATTGYGIKIGNKKYSYEEMLSLPVAMPTPIDRVAIRLEESTILTKDKSLLKGEAGDYLVLKGNYPSHINQKEVFEYAYEVKIDGDKNIIKFLHGTRLKPIVNKKYKELCKTKRT